MNNNGLSYTPPVNPKRRRLVLLGAFISFIVIVLVIFVFANQTSKPPGISQGGLDVVEITLNDVWYSCSPVDR